MPKPGGKDQTVVRGADGALYVCDKKGKLTKLSAQDAQKINDLIATAENELSAKVQQQIPVMGGGVNLCVPDIFP